jgi:hypothetical protein
MRNADDVLDEECVSRRKAEVSRGERMVHTGVEFGGEIAVYEEQKQVSRKLYISNLWRLAHQGTRAHRGYRVENTTLNIMTTNYRTTSSLSVYISLI